MKASPLLAVSFCLLAAACSNEGAGSSSAPPTAAANELPERFWSPTEPAGAQPVAAVHASAKDGERVVLVGDVGGATRVFVEGAAVFTLVDPALTSCEGDGMGCATPWDYCCADPAALRKGTATIELREDGQTLPSSPRGYHGLDHLSRVVVEGTAERDGSGNLVVVADRLHVRP